MTVTHLDIIPSTNDWLKAHRDVSDTMRVVVAEAQTHGRGSGSNTWESEHGKNLTFSILIHPLDIRPTQQFIISMMISNALVRALCEQIDIRQTALTVKWPNDIYIDDSKVCGILIENTIKGQHIADSIIGIGLNVNQQTFHSDAPNPCSLIHHTGKEIDRERLLSTIIDSFLSEMQRHAEGRIKDIEDDYKSRLYRRDGIWCFIDENGAFKAEIADVQQDGHLVLRTPDDITKTYDFHQVKFKI